MGGGWVGSLVSAMVGVEIGVDSGVGVGTARGCVTCEGEASLVAVPPQATASAVADTAIVRKVLRMKMPIGEHSTRIVLRP